DEAGALSFTLDGAPHTGMLARVYREAALADRGVQLTNTGRAPVQVAVTVNGSPLVPEPAAQQGYTIERSFRRLDGSVGCPAGLPRDAPGPSWRTVPTGCATQNIGRARRVG
uniref:hypothetical protein n=1 Tax=Methylobacterium sp. B34 TaxID=95563 RepID=UPI0005B2B701